MMENPPAGVAVPAPGRARAPRTIRGTLLLGFGLILVLWAIAGYSFTRGIGEVEQRTAALQERLTVSEQLLGSVRVQVLLGSVYLRDALMDIQPGRTSYYRAELLAIRKGIDEALRRYVALVNSPVEREMCDRLRGEVASFWETALIVLDGDTLGQGGDAQAFLRARVIPKRQVIFDVSESVQSLHRRGFASQQMEMIRIYRAMQMRAGITSVLALVLSLAIASFVLAYTGRLESRIREQQARDAQNASALQRLSARLVDAQEEERRVIARELHDEVGQALTAIKMELSMAGRAIDHQPGPASLDNAQAIADRALHMVRDLSRLLHPRMLEDLGLVTALEAYLRDFATRTGISADLVHDGVEERLESHVEITAYRIVQEALTNIARHSGASTCVVFVERLPAALAVTVEDNGRGFDPARVAAERGGVGLLGIEERTAGFRGTYKLDSRPGGGTRLRVELPVSGAANRPVERVSGGGVAEDDERQAS
jgi:signal transduction histidine kinase